MTIYVVVLGSIVLGVYRKRASALGAVRRERANEAKLKAKTEWYTPREVWMHERQLV